MIAVEVAHHNLRERLPAAKHVGSSGFGKPDVDHERLTHFDGDPIGAAVAVDIDSQTLIGRSRAREQDRAYARDPEHQTKPRSETPHHANAGVSIPTFQIGRPT
jgi:hypothetical protein